MHYVIWHQIPLLIFMLTCMSSISGIYIYIYIHTYIHISLSRSDMAFPHPWNKGSSRSPRNDNRRGLRCSVLWKRFEHSSEAARATTVCIVMSSHSLLIMSHNTMCSRNSPLLLRSVFKSSYLFNFLPDPGALNYCMHTCPDNNDGFVLVSRIDLYIWIWDLRPSIWICANWTYDNWR